MPSGPIRGTWRSGGIDMRGRDGTVYPMTGVYQEIVEPERVIVYQRGGEGQITSNQSGEQSLCS